MDWFWRAVFAGLTFASYSAWQDRRQLAAIGWVLALAALWTVRAYFWPMASCWGCRGTGRNRGSTRRRSGRHWRCDGTGRRQVLGSRQVHKTVRGIRGQAWKTRSERKD